MVAGGGAVEFPEHVADVVGPLHHLRLVGDRERQALGVDVEEVHPRGPVIARVAFRAEALGRGVVEAVVHGVDRQPQLAAQGGLEAGGREPRRLAQPRSLLHRADDLDVDRGTAGDGQARRLQPVALGGEGGKAQPVQLEPLLAQHAGIGGTGQPRHRAVELGAELRQRGGGRVGLRGLGPAQQPQRAAHQRRKLRLRRGQEALPRGQRRLQRVARQVAQEIRTEEPHDQQRAGQPAAAVLLLER